MSPLWKVKDTQKQFFKIYLEMNIVPPSLFFKAISMPFGTLRQAQNRCGYWMPGFNDATSTGAWQLDEIIRQ
jgi:hypothetical protein